MHRQENLLAGFVDHHVVDRDLLWLHTQDSRNLHIKIVEDRAPLKGLGPAKLVGRLINKSVTKIKGMDQPGLGIAHKKGVGVVKSQRACRRQGLCLSCTACG